MKIRIITLSLLIIAAMILPSKALAQKNDNFFSANDYMQDREDGMSWGWGLITQDPQNPAAPLGSGDRKSVV